MMVFNCGEDVRDAGRGYSNTILWTSDGGSSWKNITPPGAPESVISSIFFLDPQHG